MDDVGVFNGGDYLDGALAVRQAWMAILKNTRLTRYAHVLAARDAARVFASPSSRDEAGLPAALGRGDRGAILAVRQAFFVRHPDCPHHLKIALVYCYRVGDCPQCKICLHSWNSGC